ncbi:hypothetical protein BU23DRAFT_567798 [Bimuria novae-zelandiae CBS 107.79]|uniref:Uncharacterized protein n=1 Tax=Bimuria novae-zelandiae CBS 107.79 TaxID=1447943 RepID=A0A6A5VG28_9PLEO|nr:hypothetical protein BU23DRAFT_567798 [Bimuria novae-zelandiae CBS 107.79]
MAWDDDLCVDYYCDFEGWTKELFYKVDCDTLKSLKMVLRHRGVYTGNNRARLANSLYNLSTLENTPEWDPVEFKAIIFDQRSRAYKRQQNAKQTPLIAKQQQLQQDSLLASTYAPQSQQLEHSQQDGQQRE